MSGRKGQDDYLRGKMKQPVEINLAINETKLSDWHSWTLEWMPPMILMQYWYSSLWCSHPPRVTSRCCQTGSPDLLSIPLDDFLQWHSHSMSVIYESMRVRDWCGYRNLNFSKSLKPLHAEGQSFSALQSLWGTNWIRTSYNQKSQISTRNTSIFTTLEMEWRKINLCKEL